MKWQLPDIQEKIVPTNFSIWIYLLICIISVSSFDFFILLIHNDKMVSQLNMILFFFAIVPMFFSLSIMGFVYSFYFFNKFEAVFFNYCIKTMYLNWKAWCRKSIYLIDSTYVTDIDNVASKIMGVDGQAPMNPEKAVPISAIRAIDSSALYFLFDKILLPMKAKLKFFPSITILLNTNQEQEKIIDALINYSQLHDLNIKRYDIIFSNEIPTPDIINSWIDDKVIQNILLINMLFDINTQLPVTEYCCAILFSDDTQKLKYFNLKLKLFRVLNTNLPNLSDDLDYFLAAEQVEKKQLNQGWTNLSASALSIFKSALLDSDSKVKLNPNKIYELDHHLGKLDDHGWLALAFAAEGVTQGQKGQIIATKSDGAIHIMQLSDKEARFPERDKRPSGYPVITWLSLVLFLSLLFFLLGYAHKEISDSPLSILTVVMFLIILLLVTSLVFTSAHLLISEYEDEFIEMWYKEQGKISPND